MYNKLHIYYAFIHVPQIYSIHINEKYISLFLRVPIFVVLFQVSSLKYLNLITINQFVVTLLDDGHTYIKTANAYEWMWNAPTKCTVHVTTICSATDTYCGSQRPDGRQSNLLCVGLRTFCNLGRKEGSSTTKITRVQYSVLTADSRVALYWRPLGNTG